MKKKRVAIMFGGYSAEHDVSIMSAKSIAKAIDTTRYIVDYIGFDKLNRPHLIPCIDIDDKEMLFKEEYRIPLWDLTSFLCQNIDIVFPVIHGPGGEDGKLQGFLNMLKIPFVGAGVTGSSICMDKRLSKEVLKSNGFKIAPYISVSREDYLKDKLAVLQIVEAQLKFPVFAKPSNLGSSIGISKVKNKDDLMKAIEIAFQYDRHIVIEQGIDARELECAVYGNQVPIAASVGEIIPSHEMYDYEAKYSDACLSHLVVPADVSDDVIQKIRDTAVKAYKILGVEGLARVDFLVEKHTLEVYLNELNTLPGFTKYSMYPLLCADDGLIYTDLITTLIELAFERDKDEQYYTSR